MGTLFLLTYRFFRKRQILFYALLASILFGTLFLASKLGFEEDITQVIPTDKKVKQANLVFQNSRFLEKIVVNISSSDSTKTVSPNQLIQFSDIFAKQVEAKLIPNQIAEIRHSISNNQMEDLFSFFYDNLPIYLEEKDYQEIEQRMSEAGVAKSLKKNYKTLMSPASMVLKKNILQDPIGLTGIGLKKLNSLQIEGNFTIHNNHVFTKDKKNLLVFLTPGNVSNETSQNTKMLETLDSILVATQAESEGKIQGVYFGPVAVAVGNAKQIKRDINITVTIAMLILLIFISYFFRNKSVFFMIFLPAAFGALVSLAFLYLVVGKVSVIALGVGSVLLGITLDFSLHLFTHFRSKSSIEKTIKDIATPIITSSLTTGCAFLCLLLVRSNALNQLGLFAAVSVVAAALFALLILPQLLSESKEVKPHKTTFIDRWAAYPFHKNKFLLLGILALTILSLFTFKNVDFESDMDNLNYMSADLREAENQLNKISNVSLKSVYLVSEGKTLEEALNNSNAITGTIEALQEKNIVNQYASVNKLLISKQEQLTRINRWTDFWTPAKKQALKDQLITQSAKYKFKPDAFSEFFTLLDAPQQPADLSSFDQLRKLFLNEYISEKDSITTLLTVLKAKEENKSEIYTAFADNDKTIVIDKKYLTTQFIRILKEDFNLLVTISLLVVFIILIVSFGRIELGILTFIPIVLGWLITLGLMSVLDIKFNIINIILSTFIFGLGIDYSIFISKGLLQDYTYGYKNQTSYKTSILLSAITTITGIGVLIFAKHPALRSIALVSIIGILSVVLVSFTLLPLMYNFFITGRKAKGFFPYTFLNFLASVWAFSYFVFGCFLFTLIGIVFFPLLMILGKEKRKLLFHKMIMYGTRSLVYGMVHVKKRFINPNKEDFSKPAVIISNHQSFLDILVLLMIHPKMIMLTNEWVWTSPLFGKIVQMADFFPTTYGLEGKLDPIKERIEQGYSIIVYPEGTRSVDGKIKRFHKGAFYIAEQLNLDILPIVLHGIGDTNKKSDFLVNSGTMTLKFLDRITPENTQFGTSYTQRTKQIGQYFREEYKKTKLELETPDYYHDKLVKSYVYKGPILENYSKVKIKLEDKYKFFNDRMPLQGKIVDIGCGYGYLAYMLGFCSEDREILGLDYDKRKIELAANCFGKTDKINFQHADINAYELPNADAFILNDVLHYFPEDQQTDVISRCIQQLNPNGILLIRDGDSTLQDRHGGTKLTEFFSTNFGFNKTNEDNKLYFTSREMIQKTAKQFNLAVEIVDNTKFTSNVVFIIRK